MSATSEWTLMFYFAGDNQLSPSMISQLKGLKDAGFEKATRVLVYFDPAEKGARTRLFDVNSFRKRTEEDQVGDGKDSFVRNLTEDEITDQFLARGKGDGARGLTDSAAAVNSLTDFLNFGVDYQSPRHYALFLMGHGMIVGNDAFLPDEHPDTAISLVQLGDILKGFTDNVKKSGGTFELLGMHSCSMSAVEVAYQLQDTANFMMATEGVSFIGSWPYRQLLKNYFNKRKEAKRENAEMDVTVLAKKLNQLCLHNGTDFMFAGFSADICLSNLSGTQVTKLTEPLRKLTRALRGALSDDGQGRDKERIILAHWRAQSYYDENYTDLYDFCYCLDKLYDEGEKENSISVACREVMRTLDAADRRDEFDALVVFSDHFGPTYQYSHGLSIYFPWSEPVADGVQNIMENYRRYKFTDALGDDSWLNFLAEYFQRTMRRPREVEDGIMVDGLRDSINVATETVGEATASSSMAFASFENSALTKQNPADSGGAACNCASIKNYPRQFSLSQRAAKAFKLQNR